TPTAPPATRARSPSERAAASATPARIAPWRRSARWWTTPSSGGRRDEAPGRRAVRRVQARARAAERARERVLAVPAGRDGCALRALPAAAGEPVPGI